MMKLIQGKLYVRCDGEGCTTYEPLPWKGKGRPTDEELTAGTLRLQQKGWRSTDGKSAVCRACFAKWELKRMGLTGRKS